MRPLRWISIGDLLLEAAEHCRREAVLVAPFIKAPTIERLLSRLTGNIQVTCYTRWRIEEIGAGVSDLDVWHVLQKRDRSRLLLLDRLHAKYFRLDERVFVGSANLTSMALGWAPHENLELVCEGEGMTSDMLAFESALATQAIVVDARLYRDFSSLIDSFPAGTPTIASDGTCERWTTRDEFRVSAPIHELDRTWLPLCRTPEQLFSVYEGHADAMSSEGVADALADLQRLSVPHGLPRDRFRCVVRGRLLVMDTIVALDEFLAQPRRFGEVRNWLGVRLNAPNPSQQWQTLMRWLLHFFPDRYELSTPRYSEIFALKGAPRASA